MFRAILFVVALLLACIVHGDGPAVPQPPANYMALCDGITYTEIWFTSGDGAAYTRHEISVDGGATWYRLDDDYAPVEYSDHSLPQDSVCLLRAKSVGPDWQESGYTEPVLVVTGNYNETR